MTDLNISLDEKTSEWISLKIDSGAYTSADDYLNYLIQYDREREELRMLLTQAEESGISSRTIDEIVADVEKRHLNE